MLRFFGENIEKQPYWQGYYAAMLTRTLFYLSSMPQYVNYIDIISGLGCLLIVLDISEFNFQEQENNIRDTNNLTKSKIIGMGVETIISVLLEWSFIRYASPEVAECYQPLLAALFMLQLHFALYLAHLCTREEELKTPPPTPPTLSFSGS